VPAAASYRLTLSLRTIARSIDDQKTWEKLDHEFHSTKPMKLTDRSQLRRLPKRGSHDPDSVHAILDAGFLAHIGFQVNGQPFVIPTLYGRDGDHLFLHGSAVSRMLGELGSSAPACVTVTLVDGLVLARSAFHHSMNYRSVVAFGTARKIDESAQKTRALRIIAEHVIPGRWNDVRIPNEKELKATAVLEFSIEEASAKIRQGPPLDDEEDYKLPVWAGILPLGMEAATPIPDPRLPDGVEVPDHVLEYRNRLHSED
jgi:nitroimidazol reductase NimA-like FMN-containing flavoprotein (pyridoxamine 5'-phosphate oxidase superfamily)